MGITTLWRKWLYGSTGKAPTRHSKHRTLVLLQHNDCIDLKEWLYALWYMSMLRDATLNTVLNAGGGDGVGMG